MAGRSKDYILIFILINLFMPQNAGGETYREIIYSAYVKGDMNEWSHVITEMANNPDLSFDEQLELIGYYYGYTGYLIGNEKRSASGFIKKAEVLINELLKIEPGNATLLAFKGAFISFRIALSKFKAVTLGPESMRYINRAYKVEPGNIQALADKGNMLYYCPVIFGGNKKEALTYFEKAIEQIENHDDTANNWFYLNLMALLGKYYQESGEDSKAGAVFERALKVEPEFNWLKDIK